MRAFLSSSVFNRIKYVVLRGGWMLENSVLARLRRL
jgi:hypothetical protein